MQQSQVGWVEHSETQQNHSFPTSSLTNSCLVSQFRSYISFFLEQWEQEYAQSPENATKLCWNRGKGYFPGGG